MGDLGVVKFLVSQGANIRAINEDEETPILIADKAEKREVVHFLLQKGASARGLKSS